MPSVKSGVFVSGERRPTFSGLRLATRDEPEKYGRDLAGRWFLVERTVVEEPDDSVNDQWVHGHGLVFIEFMKTAVA
jgi:hypothetical protein